MEDFVDRAHGHARNPGRHPATGDASTSSTPSGRGGSCSRSTRCWRTSSMTKTSARIFSCPATTTWTSSSPPCMSATSTCTGTMVDGPQDGRVRRRRHVHRRHTRALRRQVQRRHRRGRQEERDVPLPQGHEARHHRSHQPAHGIHDWHHRQGALRARRPSAPSATTIP